jgi:hypothetical protein
VCLFIAVLSIPTPTFATYGPNDSNQNFFESIINMIFNGNKEVRSWADNEFNTKWDKDWYKEKEWDGCYKEGNTCLESIDIWRDWYCGVDKDKGKHNGHKDNYAWNYEKGNSWDKWMWW